MSAANDGGPAFPHAPVLDPNGGPHSFWSQAPEPGLSARDYFAARALQGLLAGDARPDVHLGSIYDFAQRAKVAYQFADAMLAAREGRAS